MNLKINITFNNESYEAISDALKMIENSEEWCTTTERKFQVSIIAELTDRFQYNHLKKKPSYSRNLKYYEAYVLVIILSEIVDEAICPWYNTTFLNIIDNLHQKLTA